MSESLRRYTKAMYMLDAVAQRVPADAWDNPSCCEGWTARQVAGHAAWLIKNLASLAAGNASIAEQPEADVLGDNPAAAMRSAVDNTLQALDQEGALQRVANSPLGEMPIDSFLGIVWVDPMTHAWDVADATGIAHGIDHVSAEAALAQMQPISDAIRRPGAFGDIVESADDDAVSRFIAFSGRSPVRG